MGADPEGFRGALVPSRDGEYRPSMSASERNGFNVVNVTYVVAAWLVVGLLSASQYYLAARTAGQPGAWGLQLLRELPPWQIWSLLTPAAFAVARRFPLTAPRLARHLPIHIAAALACALIYLGGWAWWTKVALPSYGAQPVTALFWAMFRARFNVAFILYWAIIGIYYALWNSRRVRIREVEAARARTELAQFRLLVLRSQLQPHFLFNTLHSIASLMDEDVRAARRLIARLSDLLRATLDLGETAEAPLAREVEFVERYLDIERVRFGPRLTVHYRISEDAGEALVPPLLLQPLVENAVRHGVAPLEQGGTIDISACRQGEWLIIDVADTGAGCDSDEAMRQGVGLANVRERLAHTYGDGQAFEISSPPKGGFRVRLRLPFRLEPRYV